MAVRRLEIPRGEKVALEKYLAKALPNGSPERAQRLLAAGRVRVNGKVARAGRKTWGGEVVEIELPAPPPPPRVEGPTIAVLAEAPGVVVVDKPAGFSSSPEPGQISVADLLAFQRGGFDVDGGPLPGVVHRLDKETSGCLAFATTDEGVALLDAGFADKRIDKRYLALVLGAPPEEGQLDTPYAKGPDGRYTTRLESPRRARLRWTVKERFAHAALIEVELDTGRTHQIRVQLSEAGFPVVGDRVYGRAHDEVRLERLALHAARLKLDLPASALAVESPVPADLAALLQRLRGA